MGFLAPLAPLIVGTAGTAGTATTAATAATSGLLGSGGAFTLGGVLGGTAALGTAGLVANSLLNPPKPPKPPAPPTMPQPFNKGASFLGASQGTANGTFFGSAGAPSSGGQKTLLGQ